MVLTAICPHLLTIRPIVVPGQAEIAVTVDVVPHETYLTVDGQEAVELLLNDRILLPAIGAAGKAAAAATEWNF